MSISRPFAYNPTQAFISGTTQTGDLRIGVTEQDYFSMPGGVMWWEGPNEEVGYVICAPVPAGNRKTPIGNIGTVRFWRSTALTDISFLALVMKLSHRTVTNISGIQPWLDSMGYWSTWINTPIITSKIAVGLGFSFYLSNKLWGWGNNYSGQLGDNSIIYRYTPVSILGAKKTFCNIAGGWGSATGTDIRGLVWCWGYNNCGQLGNNSTISVCTPISILGAKKTFCYISAGRQHAIGLDKNGLVWGWGYNGYGLLGDGTTNDKCTPVSISGAKKTFCNISTGTYHSMGIDKNGLVWGWGSNYYATLGNNKNGFTYMENKTPISIVGAKKTFCYITAGGFHTIGLDKNGLVWGWGYNNLGYLGDNSITQRKTPVSIKGAKKTFCNISAGDQFVVAIDKNGLVWSWGYNNYGQLGDNTLISKRTPVSILGSKKTFCDIATGGYHTIGLDNRSLVWGWGLNDSGELGDNTITSRLTPVRVCNL